MGFQKIEEIFNSPGSEHASNIKDIIESVKTMVDHKFYDYEENNPFGLGYRQEEQRIKGLPAKEAAELSEAVKTIPLSRMIKEFLARSSTTGINGAAYLIPLKIYNTLAMYSASRDIIADISMAVLPAAEIPGATLDVDIAQYGSYKTHAVTSGAKQMEEEIGFTKATLDFTSTWGINFNIGNDLIEDSQFSLIDAHVRMAGEQMGKESTTRVLKVMASTSNGDGTLNTVTGGADSTTLANIDEAQNRVVLAFEILPESYLAPYWVLKNGPIKDTTYFPSGSVSTWREMILHHEDPKLWGMHWIECNHPSMTTVAAGLPTNSLSYAFCKEYSYISGRKRWLRLENYSDPVRDLIGATITARQSTVSVYNQSVSKIAEA